MAAGSIVIDLLMKTGMFETDTKRAEQRLGQFKKTAAETGKIVGTAFAAGAAVATAAVASWTKDVIQLGGQLDRFSALAGSSAQDFQRWAAGASSVGIEQEKLADQLKDFNEKLGEFQQTGGGGMKDFFEQIAPLVGVTAKAFEGLSGPQALQLYYDSLEKANLSQERMSFYLESMASDTTALIPLLRDGGRGFREWGEAADRAGAVLDDKTIQATKDFRESAARLDLMLDGLKTTIAVELLPPLVEFTDLVGDSENQRALQTIAALIGDIAGAAVTAAGKIAELTSSYRNLLADRGFLPAGQLDSEAQLHERIRKLSRMQYGGDLLNTARRAIFGDAIQEQLREAIEELNRFQWRNVISGADSVPASSTGTKPQGVKPPTGRGARVQRLPDFAREEADRLRAMLEAVADARGEFEAWAARLEGPVADANYRFAADMERLNELARTGEVEAQDLAAAQEGLRREHEANVRVLERQLPQAEEAIRFLEEESMWLRATEDGQRRLAAARMLGADATQAQIDKAEALMRVNEQLEESLRNWDDLNRNISDTLFDVVTGADSALDAVKNLFDTLAAQITRNITDDWADSITGWLKGLGGGGNETAFGTGSFSSSGGGFWSSLRGAIGFGGSKAAGGDVLDDRAYLVGEQGPEIFVPRTWGTILPAQQTAAALGGRDGRRMPVTVNQTVQIQGRLDNRSINQIAKETLRRQRHAAARFA